VTIFYFELLQKVTLLPIFRANRGIFMGSLVRSNEEGKNVTQPIRGQGSNYGILIALKNNNTWGLLEKHTCDVC
jgi:hypothetical protein